MSPRRLTPPAFRLPTYLQEGWAGRKALLAPLARAALATLALALLLAPAPASAAPTKIAGWGQGAGRVNLPEGVAVDNSCARHVPPLSGAECEEFDPHDGELYVADGNNFRIDRFGPAGDFQLAWGAGVSDGVSEELQVCGPAVEVKRCFAGNHGPAVAGAVEPSSLAVEPSTGDVYVAEGGRRRVSRFTAEGRFVLTFGKGVNKTTAANLCTAVELEEGEECGAGGEGAGPGEFALPRSLAFDGEGGLWVNDGERLQRFDSGGGFLEEVPLPAGSQNSALAIDPASGDFYVLGPRGSNEGQRVTVPNDSLFSFDRSEFTLGFEGEATETIAISLGSLAGLDNEAKGEALEGMAASIQAALEALPAIGEGDVSVAPGGLAGDFRVTFIRDLGGRDVPELVATTIGETPPVTVSTATAGGHGSVRRLDSETGAQEGELDNSAGDLPEALATDSEGNLYLADGAFGSPYHLERYDSSGNLTSVFGAGQVLGGPQGNALALDEARGHLYTASSRSAPTLEVHPGEKANVAVQRFSLPEPGPLPENERVKEGTLLPTSATLAADLNPEGHKTTYRFEYDTSPYEGEAGHGTQVPVPDATLEEGGEPYEGFEGKSVSADLEELIPDTTYHFRLLATDRENPACAAEGEECTTYGEDTTFTTRTAVGIEAQWASELSAHEATLNARLDPLGVKGEWWVEYDTAPYTPGEAPHGTSVPVPHPALPASEEEVPVAVALGGLDPATAYHYRFAASDEREVKEGGETLKRSFTVYGSGQSFTTQPAALGAALPDARAWEMVSPPDKHGGRIASFDATQGGLLQAAADGEALAYLSYGSLEAHPEGNRVIEQSSELARRAPGGAWETTDITPPHTAAAGFQTGAGLEYKLFSANLGRAVLDPHAPVQLSPYATERTPYLRENGDPPAYTPLVTAAGVPAGTEFGEALKALGATADLSHVVLNSSVPLAADDAAGSLYEWSGGALEPLSLPPGGEGAVSAELGGGEASTRGAVSTDGSRVFWSRGNYPPFAALYVRDTARGQTIRLDEVQPGAFGTGAVAPLFQGASTDGTVALFTDTQNLTADANEEGADLYRWTAPGTHGCEEAGGCLEDLTAEVAPGEAAADVRLVLPGVSRDGSAAYLVATGVLDSAPNAHGESATPGQPNLYAWRAGQSPRFVARLSGGDCTDWGCGYGGGAAWSLTAQASPSGRYLAFMSSRPLSGYDNRAVGSGERAQEVFRYDAQSEALACISCDPSGARPRALVPGPDAGQLSEEFDPNQLWRGKPVAAAVPEASRISHFITAHFPRYVHDDGRVFFNAAGPLVSADSNGSGDVYQYEPSGVGSCSASAADAGTAVAAGGCVSLISSGTAEGTAAFLDASEGARDVSSTPRHSSRSPTKTQS